MSKGFDVADRIAFLAEKYNVFEPQKNKKGLVVVESDDESENIVLQSASNSNILAILNKKKNASERYLKKVKIAMDVFSSMIAADPTNNKSHVQWMLNVFNRLMKEETIEAARQFVEEDLPLANQYLIIFEANKRKKRFKEICQASEILKHITDPSDINQFKSLSQLYDAVDPFIEKKPSEIEALMQRYVGMGEALIPVRDRKFTVFVPKTRNANVIFGKYANWCTAREGNGMFDNYTSQTKPNGKKSDIYIIIDNKFFSGESQDVYQLHFESGQMKDRHNSSNVSIFQRVLIESESLSNYFYNELLVMAKQNRTGLDNNKYIDALISFGFTESLFDILDVNVPVIRFSSREVPKLPEMSRFKLLDTLCIMDAKLVELHPSVGNLQSLEMLVLTGNLLKSLPHEIGNLKELVFLNIVGNKLTDIPESIANLDPSKGGKLCKIACREEDLGAKTYNKLRTLLPTTSFN